MDTCLLCQQQTEEDIRNKSINRKLKQWKKQEDKVVNLLLLGTGESGKSTITKQMKIIHIDGYSHQERLKLVPFILRNIKDAALTICGAMSILNISLCDLSLQTGVEYLMKYAIKEDFDYPQIFFEHCGKLWADPGFQECYSRNNEYQLIDSAKYFLDKISLIQKEDYIPTNQDILRCRTMTNKIQWVDFAIADGNTDVQFRVYDVGGQRGERRKWIQVFSCATAILFVLDISSFDLTLREDASKNRLLEATAIFEQVWTSRYLKDVSIILFFNKIDLLEEKINAGRSFQHFVDSLPADEKYAYLYKAYADFTGPKDHERREFLSAFCRPLDKVDNSPSFISHSNSSIEPEKSKKSRRVSRLPYKGKNDTRRRSTHSRSESSSNRAAMTVNEEVIRTAVFIKRAFLQLVYTPKSTALGADFHADHFFESYYTCAVDTDNIRKILDGCKAIIVREHLKKYNVI